MAWNVSLLAAAADEDDDEDDDVVVMQVIRWRRVWRRLNWWLSAAQNS